MIPLAFVTEGSPAALRIPEDGEGRAGRAASCHFACFLQRGQARRRWLWRCGILFGNRSPSQSQLVHVPFLIGHHVAVVSDGLGCASFVRVDTTSRDAD